MYCYRIFKAMEEVYNKNLTKAIGLSNFSPSQIKRIFENSTVKPHNLQVKEESIVFIN